MKIKSATEKLESGLQTVVIFAPISTEVYGYQQVAQRGMYNNDLLADNH